MPGSFGLICISSCARRVAGFIRIRVRSLIVPSRRRIHSGSFAFYSANILDAWFIRVCLGLLSANRGHPVHSDSLGLTHRAYRSPGSFGFSLILSSAARSRRFHSDNRGFTLARLGFAGYILFHVDSLMRP